MKKLLLAALFALAFPVFAQSMTYTKADYTVGTNPDSLAVDKSGNVYVVNGWSKTISKINTGGMVTTVATLGNYPTGLAVDTAGNLYTITPNTVNKINQSTGATIGTYAVGTNPTALAFDAIGNLYVANSGSDTISKITTTGVVSTFATLVKGSFPRALAFDTTGNLYTANMSANTVNKLNASTGAIMGTYTVGTSPMALAFDAAGNLYVTNGGTGGFIKKITTTGAVSTFAALGATAYPRALAFDTIGNLYMADASANTVNKLNASTGAIMDTYAVGDDPMALAFDTAGNLYVANWRSGNVTKLSFSGASSQTTSSTVVSQNTPSSIPVSTTTIINQSSTPTCLNLPQNLTYGATDTATNNNVTALQDFLFKEGFLKTNDRGRLGTLTRQAVSDFQVKSYLGRGISANSIDSTLVPSAQERAELAASGFALDRAQIERVYVGPYTRAKIKVLTCGVPTIAGPITTVSCIPGYLFNSVTKACVLDINTTNTSSNPIDAGCLSGYAFSITTGKSCGVVTAPQSTLPISITYTKNTLTSLSDSLSFSVSGFDYDNAQGCLRVLAHPTSSAISSATYCTSPNDFTYFKNNSNWSWSSATKTWKQIWANTNVPSIFVPGVKVQTRFRDSITGKTTDGQVVNVSFGKTTNFKIDEGSFTGTYATVDALCAKITPTLGGHGVYLNGEAICAPGEISPSINLFSSDYKKIETITQTVSQVTTACVSPSVLQNGVCTTPSVLAVNTTSSDLCTTYGLSNTITVPKAGNTSKTLTMPKDGAYAFTFTTGGAGSIGSSNTQYSAVNQYMTISKNKCDFSPALETTLCGQQGATPAYIRWKARDGIASAYQCILEPNTLYHVNLRDANRSYGTYTSTCPNGGCDFKIY